MRGGIYMLIHDLDNLINQRVCVIVIVLVSAYARSDSHYQISVLNWLYRSLILSKFYLSIALSIISVENIQVGNLPVKSISVKSLSSMVILLNNFENQHFWHKIFFTFFDKFVPNFYHFVTNFRHITSFMILKSNQGVSKIYQGLSGGSFTPGNGHGWHCG
jgi:hypothetical protein